MRISFFFSLFFVWLAETNAQCGTPVNSFPYSESFETSDGGWVSGGFGNDWAWGTPAKTIINTAGGGVRCWITGGLTGGSYTDGAASWLQSPCFDFSALSAPFISFKINWETEQQFDGVSFQYSVDNGASWTTIRPLAGGFSCLQKNWFNQDPVTYLSPLTNERRGWSGTIKPSSGSCRGGHGSNGWVEAFTLIPELEHEPEVIFRFIFGAGTICNSYDGVAVDDIFIGEMQPIPPSFDFSCRDNRTIDFKNTSENCLTNLNWDFGDPASGSENTSILPDPVHTFSSPGTYTVRLTAGGAGMPVSTITQEINIIDASVTLLTMADCQTNSNGSLSVLINGHSGPYSIAWNTTPVQTTMVAGNLAAGLYTVTVSGENFCTATAEGRVEMDFSCSGIYFPSAFTPNGDGRNDRFGPAGGLGLISNYRLSIYNRWGERVFYSTNPFEKWDGWAKGKPAESNVFAWYAEYDLPDQPKQLKKGTVMVIR